MNGNGVTVAMGLSAPAAPVDSTVLVQRSHAVHMVRITASDLCRAQKQCARIHAQFGDGGDRVAALLDLVVAVAPEVHTARTEARSQPAAIDTTAGERSAISGVVQPTPVS